MRIALTARMRADSAATETCATVAAPDDCGCADTSRTTDVGSALTAFGVRRTVEIEVLGHRVWASTCAADSRSTAGAR